jgi:hypothetical protein
MKLLMVLIAGRTDLRGAAGAYLQEGGSRPEADAK